MITKLSDVIPNRSEIELRYFPNKAITEFTTEQFENSKKQILEFKFDKSILCSPTATTSIKAIDFFGDTNMLNGELPYGSSNLFNCGCAVFAAYIGIKEKFPTIEDFTIKDLADLISKRGYYSFGTGGTYHNLFDHLNCRRLASVFEVMYTMKYTPVITLLVSNHKYHNDPLRAGSHFITLTGIQIAENGGLVGIIDDPVTDISEIDFYLLMDATRIAWAW